MSTGLAMASRPLGQCRPRLAFAGIAGYAHLSTVGLGEMDAPTQMHLRSAQLAFGYCTAEGMTTRPQAQRGCNKSVSNEIV